MLCRLGRGNSSKKLNYQIGSIKDHLFASHALAGDFEVVIDESPTVFLSAFHQQVLHRSLTIEDQINVA